MDPEPIPNAGPFLKILLFFLIIPLIRVLLADRDRNRKRNLTSSQEQDLTSSQEQDLTSSLDSQNGVQPESRRYFL